MANNLTTDFKASISIVNPSKITKSMQADLPDNYTSSQNSNIFAFLYGTGYNLDLCRDSLLQVEANNYLYSPDIQKGYFAVSGIGKYLIEFDIPFTAPPLDVSISGASTTDAFIEYTSRYGMIVNVQTDAQDVLSYTASGAVGAASDEYMGDALYLNFGTLYQFPRIGDAIIDSTYVNFYQKTNKFMNVQNIIPVENVSVNFDTDGNVLGSPVITKNFPPINSNPLVGVIQPTDVITQPLATHQLLDLSGNLIALLDTSTISASFPVSAYYSNVGTNIYKDDVRVYVLGPVSNFAFNSWSQPSFVQEVFRADNKYRRLLSAINQSIILGPTLAGVSNMTEALISQPYIPLEYWNQSDYRVYKNTLNETSPKYLTFSETVNGIITAVNSDSQHGGYPTVPPTVEVKRIIQPWSPDTICYNNKPVIVPLDVPVTTQVQELNIATRFDITNELTKQLRLGIDMPQGGIINWNYGYSSVGSGSLPSTGFALYEKYNYAFLNNAGDTISDINIFWYAQQFNPMGPTGYRTFGPLRFNRDYFALATDVFLLADGTYALPSELLSGYNANSSVPYFDGSTDSFGNTSWRGNDLVNQKILPASLPSLPSIILQIDLSRLSINNVNNKITKFPTNAYDFIFYSYGQVTLTQATVVGNFLQDDVANVTDNSKTTSYYDADTSSALQPTDSPFATSFNHLAPTSLAQTSFGKLVTETGYEYVLSMIGGQITFNKTVYAQDIKLQTSFNASSDTKPPGILVMQALTTTPGNSGNQGQAGANQFILTGVVSKSTNSLGVRYFQFQYGDYVLLDTNGNPIAILDSYSLVNFASLVGTMQTVYGVVDYTIWDTRIPVQSYRTTSPVFEVSTNYDATAVTFTPDTSIASYYNENFLVIINGLPLGNQQSITASWTFNVTPTTLNNSVDANAIAFSDRNVNGSTIYGIMSLFTGLNLISDELDPDNAIYNQTYVSPSFNGYFINYQDYINTLGSKLTPFGDKGNASTLTNPIINKPAPGTPQPNTILNFFNPGYGFISISILPNQEFYNSSDGAPVAVIRPNNNGFALQISGDSYAGLVFYGKSGSLIVDKPTRLLADFTYSSANAQIRTKTIEIEDGGLANFVDGMNPNKVQTGSVFHIAGNSFKYPGKGFDQALNQYDTNTQPAYESSGEYYDRFPVADSLGVIPPVLFNTDPSQNAVISLSNGVGNDGPPHRYRRPPTENSSIGLYQTPSISALSQDYYNLTPEKIAYLQFDLTTLPIDAIVNNGILEIYFASGFTVKQAKDVNFELNKNISWEKSRLSGNGKTFLKTLKNADGSTYQLYQPLQNQHWRKNFFEIVIPYAFMSEPLGIDYGIRNIFAPQNANTMPKPQNPQPNLEYLGYLNIDAIDTASLTDYTNFIENSVGLTSTVLSSKSVVFLINGVLHFNYNSDGTTSLANCFDTNNGIIYQNLDNCYITINTPGVGTIIGQEISQNSILSSQKVLVYPFGIEQPEIFYYGYVTSVLPSNFINFDATEIATYQKILTYVAPLYSQYTITLLEADTYLAYQTFGRDTTIDGTSQDITF